MADAEHLEILRSGVATWNRWRRAHPGVRPDLSGDSPGDTFEDEVRALTSSVLNEVLRGRNPVDPDPPGALSGAVLNRADLRDADLSGARLDGAMLIDARLSGAHLRRADLSGCVLTGARLTEVDGRDANFNAATLRWADLGRAQLAGANLKLANADGITARRAVLRGANLFYTSLVQADLSGADLTDAFVYGVSAWDVQLKGAVQDRLVITTADEPTVLVDDLQVAQFLHLIISNRRIRGVIDALTTKVVLILGRFTPPRKIVLDCVRDGLRRRGFVPVLFDFDRPANRDFTETVVTLAHLARFIVADITDPASLPKELEAIIPRLAVPVVPLLQQDHEPYAMFSDYWKYDWVLDIVTYRDGPSLVRTLDRKVVGPAEQTAQSLTERRARHRSIRPRHRR
jgi:hypothetical protein